jgi:uncharacterized protein YecE (DUF72 family)
MQTRQNSGKNAAAEVRIGTSGWHYKHWVGRFYPQKMPAARMLAYYCERFDTVELNNSFYRLPSKQSLAAWRDSVPGAFCFAVKGSRFLTHMKKLKDPEQGLARFLDAIEVLDAKLGPVLFQLPPQWEINYERLETFLDLLPREHRYAFEFRNMTWNVKPIFDLLGRYNAAYCVFDLAGTQSPIKLTADFAYVRLHGPGGKYQGTYSDKTIGEWAQRIETWRRQLQGVFIYFDNDEAGYAPHDALRLKALVEPEQGRQSAS